MTLPFGEIIGIDFNGIVAYSCNNSPKKDNLSFIQNNIYSGIKWQCIEYVRRWLIINYNTTFEEIDMAYMMFSQSKIKFINILSGYESQYIKNYNGRSYNRLPTIGSIIVWDKNNNYKTGHVAIVSKVTHDYIYIAEQNWDDTLWNRPFSRKIKINYLSNYSVFLNDYNQFGLTILGWIIII
jgi:glutathionylspermidine amidase/synthetase